MELGKKVWNPDRDLDIAPTCYIFQSRYIFSVFKSSFNSLHFFPIVWCFNQYWSWRNKKFAQELNVLFLFNLKCKNKMRVTLLIRRTYKIQLVDNIGGSLWGGRKIPRLISRLTLDAGLTHLRRGHILVGHAHIWERFNKNLMLSETGIHDSARDRIEN